MNIMRDAENNEFQINTYLNSVRGIDMHIIEQSKTLDTVIDMTKN